MEDFLARRAIIGFWKYSAWWS